MKAAIFVVVTIGVVGFALATPALIIIAINTLFDLRIEITLWSYMSVVFLLWVINRLIGAQK